MIVLEARDIDIWSQTWGTANDLHWSLEQLGTVIYLPTREVVEVTVDYEDWIFWSLKNPQWATMFRITNAG